MPNTARLFLAVLLAAAPVTAVVAQQPASHEENCDAGVARRQLTGQPMTDFMAACRADRVNPETLGKICNSNADSRKLSAAARQSYIAECTKGPA
jgi:hypothetical protein